MALATSCAALLAAGLVAMIATALGHRLLRLSALEFSCATEHLLCSVALGVICVEILFFVTQILDHIRTGVVIVLILSLLLGIADIARVFAKASGIAHRALSGSRPEKVLIALTATVLLVEGFAAMAPLTGSDALHYHFTAQLLILRSGFHPTFFLSHSFLCGQSHLLVLAALALGSEQLAMGLLFLGGVLAAAAGACLARHWTDRRWSWMVALVFLVTPVVFWQISSAGAPDVWMAFFATLGVIVISRCKERPHTSHAVLAGALAGAVAGAKYTGCIVAASMALAYFREVRSAAKSFMFLAAALGAGVWPYARNFAWTGDPMFPFLMRWLAPGKVNAYTLASYLADTGASEHRGVRQILEFPFFAAIDPAHLGFWQFLGPLVLAFAPLLVLVVRNTPAWRAALTVWIASALGIGWSSGMTRFLLPVLPIALAAVLSGVAQRRIAGWPAARYLAAGSLCGFLLFGAAGLLVYERSALSAAAGLTSREDYLRAHAPEYEKAQFINHTLAGREREGKVLVFLRPTYYLGVPFLYGDPSASWAVDPARLQTPAEWREMFREKDIRWVVRSREYPAAIAGPLNALETEGKLVPIARAEVSDFQGMRLSGERQLRPVVILEVQE
jgi:Protein of unknown function (DUF1420)